MHKVALSLATVKAVFKNKIALTLTLLLVAASAVALAAPFFGGYRTAFRRLESAALAKAAPAPQAQGCCSDVPGTLRRMVGTYYSAEGNLKSTLVLNNKGPNAIAVTPILYSLGGSSFTAAPVTVGGEASLDVDLNALAAQAGPAFRSGSFEFTYTGRMLEIGGGLRIVDAARSLIFDEQLLEPGMKFSSPQLEAVYAVPFQSAEVSVIFTNTTSQPLSVSGDATFAGANGHYPVQGQLGPHETRVVDLPRGLVRQAKAGAVSLAYDGAKGALLAVIHVQEPGKGFSAAVNFADPAQGKTAQWHGAGLRLGFVGGEQLAPTIAVRNLGSSNSTVTGRIQYSTASGGAGTANLANTVLAPGEMKLIPSPNLNLLPTNISTAGLELEYTGAPGSVIAAAHSATAGGNQVFALPLKDPQGGMSSTGGYPWFISGNSSTVVFLKNTTDAPQRFYLELVYPGGRWGAKLRTIDAHQTLAFDVRAIRDSQEKDVDGDAIPADATVGHVAWGVLGNQNKVLIGRAQTVDFSTGLASTYECQCLCPPSIGEARLLPGNVSGLPGDTQQCTAQERFKNCFDVYGDWYDVNPSRVTFSSSNSSVATINSSGLSSALAPGTATLFANWDADSHYWDNEVGWCFSNATPTTASLLCTVDAPYVTWRLATAGNQSTGFSVLRRATLNLAGAGPCSEDDAALRVEFDLRDTDICCFDSRSFVSLGLDSQFEFYEGPGTPPEHPYWRWSGNLTTTGTITIFLKRRADGGGTNKTVRIVIFGQALGVLGSYSEPGFVVLNCS
jgi:hypothetical protein